MEQGPPPPRPSQQGLEFATPQLAKKSCSQPSRTLGMREAATRFLDESFETVQDSASVGTECPSLQETDLSQPSQGTSTGGAQLVRKKGILSAKDLRRVYGNFLKNVPGSISQSLAALPRVPTVGKNLRMGMNPNPKRGISPASSTSSSGSSVMSTQGQYDAPAQLFSNGEGSMMQAIPRRALTPCDTTSSLSSLTSTSEDDRSSLRSGSEENNLFDRVSPRAASVSESDSPAHSIEDDVFLDCPIYTVPKAVTPKSKTSYSRNEPQPSTSKAVFKVPMVPSRGKVLKAKSSKAKGTKKVKKRRLRVCQMTETMKEDYRRCKKSMEKSIPNLSFQMLVREVMQSFKSDFNVNVGALECLHEASETYLVRLFEKINLAARHAGRVTIRPGDMDLARKVGNDDCPRAMLNMQRKF